MRKVITNKPINQTYPHDDQPLLLYDLLREPTVKFRIVCGCLVKADWLPTENDVLQICEDLLRVSPTFGSQLLELAVSIPIPEDPRPKRKFSGKLEEVLL